MAKSVDHGLIFEGDVKVRNRNQAGAGFIDIGNTTALTTATSVETAERISKQKGTYGSALDSLKTMQPTEIGLTLDTFDKDNLALALMGEAAVIAAEAVSVTNEEIVISQYGHAYKLAHGNIDPATVKVVDSDGTDVPAAELDINANVGLIAVKSGTEVVVEGETVKVTYKTRAAGGYKVSAATLSRLDLEIYVDGRNRVTGEAGVLHIPHAVLAADGEIDWFGDDFNEAAFTGTAVVVDGETSTYSFTSYNN
ncbi:hypothetical protein J2T38_001689 [Neisseria perflava]|uniref:phage tail tube protein n=1 Tax=Neisseria perflava TaxID=33053 RepID=UPI00209DC365|nr:hypothetical protein [Neisseria perflava]MCP1772853.1 hypothetical protein [Neisseria perflava]